MKKQSFPLQHLAIKTLRFPFLTFSRTLEVRLHTTRVVFRHTFDHNYSCSWRVDLPSMILPHISTIHWVGKKMSWCLMGSLSKSNCLLQITSSGTSLKFFPYPPTYKLWTKQNQRKQTITIRTTPNYTLYCSWTIKSSCDCGYHRMHLLWEKVTIDAPYPSKIEPKKLNYNHQPLTGACV